MKYEYDPMRDERPEWEKIKPDWKGNKKKKQKGNWKDRRKESRPDKYGGW